MDRGHLTPSGRCTVPFQSPFESDISSTTAQNSAFKQDLFMLTSFESSLERREVSEDVTPVFLEEGEGDVSVQRIRQEARDLKKRVTGLLTRLREESRSFVAASQRPAEDSISGPSSINETSLSQLKAAQIVSKVEGMAFAIEKLAENLETKQRDLERVNAENSLLLRKLSRLHDVVKRYEEKEMLEVEVFEQVPTCEGCNLL